MTVASTPSPLSPRDDRVSVRLRFRDDARIGPGKVALLEAISRSGSVAQAGASLHMSARRAWLLIDSLNRAFDTPVVVTDDQPMSGTPSAMPPGPAQNEAHLTEFGQSLIDAYRAVEADTQAAVGQRFAAIMARLKD
ncbi:MAG: winged helix-turn-helix domain-containing protein [Burkholderiaceae bacterium]